MLKPQDTLLVLKYWSSGARNLHPSVRELAESLKISIGEISKSARRLVAAHLVVERNGNYIFEKGALLEWLCYGVRYAYPQESIGYGRGMPTSWNCPLVKTDIVPPQPAIVWSTPGGNVQGTQIKPIHSSVLFAAAGDELLYQILSLSEAVRGGRPRELVVARDVLAKLLKSD